MNTYAKFAANPRRMHTSKIIGLKVSCNEHLQKNRGRGGLIVTHGCGLYLQPTQTIATRSEVHGKSTVIRAHQVQRSGRAFAGVLFRLAEK
jgi:hypothetical protein